MAHCRPLFPLVGRSARQLHVLSCRRWLSTSGQRRCSVSPSEPPPPPPPPPKSFADLGIHPLIVEQLAKQNITRPTRIQAKGIPALQKNQNVFLCDQTGSGKTLCYLVPLLHSLALKPNEVPRTPSIGYGATQHLKGVVMVPNSLLVSQICQVFDRLAEPLGFSAAPLHSYNRLQILPKHKLLVCTPDGLKRYQLDEMCLDVEQIVLDNFVNEDFLEATVFERLILLFPKVLKEKQQRDVVPRIASVGATLHIRARGTSRLMAVMKEINSLPMSTVQSVESLYRFPSSLSFSFENYATNQKMHCLVRCLLALRSVQTGQKPRVMIHCINGQEIDDVIKSLETASEWYSEGNHKLGSLGMWWRQLITPVKEVKSAEGIDMGQQSLHAVRVGKKNIIVSHGSDLAGIDIPSMNAVIVMDFALLQSAEEYLDIAGRTGRNGEPGKVIFMVPGMAERSAMSRLVESVLLQDPVASFSTVSSRTTENRVNKKLDLWNMLLQNATKTSLPDSYLTYLDDHIESMNTEKVLT